MINSIAMATSENASKITGGSLDFLIYNGAVISGRTTGGV